MEGFVFGISILVAAVAIMVTSARLAAASMPRAVDEWASRRSLDVDGANGPLVAAYIRLTTGLRTLGVIAGACLTPLAGWAFGVPLVVPSHGIAVFVGYLAGAVWAEVSLARAAHHRGTVVSPRLLGDYLGRRLLAGQRLAAAAVAVAVVVLASVPLRDGYGTQRATAFIVGPLVCAAAIALEAIQRWLLRRPQPFGQTSLVHADDAIRSSSLHAVAGASIALSMLGFSAVAWALALSDVQVLRSTFWFPAFVLPWIALVIPGRVARRQWRVTRKVQVA